jgi:hypothetical protein
MLCFRSSLMGDSGMRFSQCYKRGLVSGLQITAKCTHDTSDLRVRLVRAVKEV